jgi:hypothetical protein
MYGYFLNRKTVFGLSIFFLSAALALTISMPTNAEGGQALEVAPPIINLTADPGQTINTQIIVRNISNGELSIVNEINDFIAADENGAPKVIIDEEIDNPYSLKAWIEPIKELKLASKKTEKLNVTIRVPKNASPGGYYGAVRFSGIPSSLEGTGVSLSASIGSLLMIRVSGDTKQEMAVEEFYTSHKGYNSSVFEGKPIDFSVRLKNNGNVFEKPRGQILIYDMFNNLIAAVNVNLSSSNVLPDSVRKFDQTLDSATLGTRMLFGQYTAKLKMTYGADYKQTVETELTFWVIPYTLILTVIAGIVGGFFALRFAIKRYNQYIIDLSRRADEGRKSTSRRPNNPKKRQK